MFLDGASEEGGRMGCSGGGCGGGGGYNVLTPSDGEQTWDVK